MYFKYRKEIMERYTYNNCTVVVHLPKNQDTVRQETERFIKEVWGNEKKKVKENR